MDLTDRTVTVAGGEKFHGADSARLAALIFRRFGRDLESAASAWRRLLQNSCTDNQFEALALAGLGLIVDDQLRESGDPYQVEPATEDGMRTVIDAAYEDNEFAPPSGAERVQLLKIIDGLSTSAAYVAVAAHVKLHKKGGSK